MHMNIVCKMTAILFGGRLINSLYLWGAETGISGENQVDTMGADARI